MGTVKADPSYRQIMELINFMLEHTDGTGVDEIIKKINWETIDEMPYMLPTGIEIIRYNYAIHACFRKFMYFLHYEYYSCSFTTELVEYEPKFVELFHQVMTINYKNIRYYFTQCLIAECASYPSLNYISEIKYKNVELIYLLERINPDERDWFYPYRRKRVELIYNTLTDLRLTWMAIFTKI